MEDVAKDTKKSQISIVENVKIVEDDLKEKEVLKKLSGSDERMNQFLNLIAPNSIKSNNLATFDKQKEIKNLAVKGSNEGIFIKDKPIDNSQFIDNNFSKQKFFSSYHDNLYIKQKSYDESVLSMNAYKNRPSSIENENTFNLKKVKSDESKQPQYIESLESEGNSHVKIVDVVLHDDYDVGFKHGFTSGCVKNLSFLINSVFLLDRCMGFTSANKLIGHNNRSCNVFSDVFYFNKTIKFKNQGKNSYGFSSLMEKVFSLKKLAKCIDYNLYKKGYTSFFKKVFFCEKYPRYLKDNYYLKRNDDFSSVWKHVFLVDKLLKCKKKTFYINYNILNSTYLMKSVFKYDKPLKCKTYFVGKTQTCRFMNEVFKYNKSPISYKTFFEETRNSSYGLTSLWNAVFKVDRSPQSNIDTKFINDKISNGSVYWSNMFSSTNNQNSFSFLSSMKTKKSMCTLVNEVFNCTRSLENCNFTKFNDCSFFKNFIKTIKSINSQSLDSFYNCTKGFSFCSLLKEVFSISDSCGVYTTYYQNAVKNGVEDLNDATKIILLLKSFNISRPTIYKDYKYFLKNFLNSIKLTKLASIYNKGQSYTLKEVFYVNNNDQCHYFESKNFCKAWFDIFRFNLQLHFLFSNNLTSVISQCNFLDRSNLLNLYAVCSVCERKTNLKEITLHELFQSTLYKASYSNKKLTKPYQKLAFYFKYCKSLSPTINTSMYSIQLAPWCNNTKKLKCKLADCNTLHNIFPRVSFIKDYKEDGEWKSFEEEEEKMSAEQLEEIVKQHKALREKEMQLSTETKMKKREVKSKLSAVIDLMKVNKNELTDDLKIKNTEELREIKSDVEMLESRFKTIGEVFPPLEFTDEDNYKTCMEKLHERTASLAERQKSMFDAKRFSRDLVDAIYDIEESIKDSLEKYSEYKGKLSNYENDFKERHLNNVMILNATKEEFKERELEFDNLKLELKLKKEFLNEENIELIKKEIKNIDSILVNLNLTIVKHQKTEEEIVDEAEKLSETNLFEKVHSLQKLIKIQVNVDDLLVGIEEDAIDLKQKIKNVKTKIGLLSDSQSNDNKALEIKKKLDEIRSRKVSRSNKDEISLSALHNKYNELIQAYNKIENENNFDVGSLDFNLKSLKDYLDEQKSIKLDVEESFDELKSKKKLSEYKELLDQETAKDLEYEPIEENNLYKTISTMLHDLDEFINNYYKKSISKLFSDVDFLRSKRLENSKLDKALVKELQNKFEDLKTKCHDNKFDFDISNKEINSLLDSVEFSKRLDFQKEDVLKLSLENQILFLKEKVLDEKTAFVDYEPVSELEAFKNLFKMVEESEVVVEKQIKIKNFKHELLELNELQNKYRAEDEKVIFNLQQSLNILEENAKSKGIFANKVNSLKAEINSLLNSIKSISTKHEINDEKKSYDFQLQFYQNQILIKKKELSDYKPIKEKEAYLAIGTRLNSIESAIQKSVEESHKQQKITDLSREITSLQRETTEKAAIEPTIGSSNKEDVSSSIASSIDKEEFVKTFREIATNDDFVRNILSDIVLSKEDTTNAKGLFCMFSYSALI